jgi:prepilin-type N-terminal cleavage/methylation domain-containing protein
MLKWMRKQLNQAQKGFTLIELLIVVAIIGILAAIAIPNLITAQRRARYSRAAGDTKSIITQAQVVTSDNNKVTTVLGGGFVLPAGLWDATAPNQTIYMAKVNDPWAPGVANYKASEAAATGGCGLGPGCVVYAAWTVGGDATDDSAAWVGKVGTVPGDDDLGNSTEVGCTFGPNVGITNPC